MSSWHAGAIYGVVLGSVGTLILVGLAILKAESRERLRQHFETWERELDQ